MPGTRNNYDFSKVFFSPAISGTHLKTAWVHLEDNN